MKADNSEHPSTVIANTGADLANDLAGKRYVLIETGSGFIPTSMLKTNSKDNAKKIMYNGQVIIRKGDKCYNLLGQEL